MPVTKLNSPSAWQPAEDRLRDAPEDSRAVKPRAVVLLNGLVRGTDLTSKLTRSVLDLPIDEKHTLLEHCGARAVPIPSGWTEAIDVNHPEDLARASAKTPRHP